MKVLLYWIVLASALEFQQINGFNVAHPLSKARTSNQNSFDIYITAKKKEAYHLINRAIPQVFGSRASSGSEDPSLAKDNENQTPSFNAGDSAWTRPHKYTNARVIFLGSGSSGGSPMASHLMDGMETHCGTCRSILSNPNPLTNKNYRNNPCILIQYYGDRNPNTAENDKKGSTTSDIVQSVHKANNPEIGQFSFNSHPPTYPVQKSILFDAGKTFRETVCRWFPVFGIQSIDAILLTHGHADAMLGLDDLRSLQGPRSPLTMPIYSDRDTFDVLRRTFSYLMPADLQVDDTGKRGESQYPPYVEPYPGVSHGTGRSRNSWGRKTDGADVDTWSDGFIGQDQKMLLEKGGENIPLSTRLVAPTMRPIPQLKSKSKEKPEEEAKKNKKPIEVKRAVSRLSFECVDPFVPFLAGGEGGLPIEPVPLIHGEDLICMGYLIGQRRNIAYFSDLSRVPTETVERMVEIALETAPTKENTYTESNTSTNAAAAATTVGAERSSSEQQPDEEMMEIKEKHQQQQQEERANSRSIDLMVLDSVFWERPHATHWNVQDAASFVKLLPNSLVPRVVLLIGMHCEIEHAEGTEKLVQIKDEINDWLLAKYRASGGGRGGGGDGEGEAANLVEDVALSFDGLAFDVEI